MPMYLTQGLHRAGGPTKAVFAKPNVRAEAGPTAKRQARDADNSLRRFAGLAF